MNTRMDACLHRQHKARHGSSPATGHDRRRDKPDSKNSSPLLAQLLSLLTAHEMEVLRLLGGWRRKEEIVSFLGISPRTVAAHRAHIRKKRRIGSLPEHLRFAVQKQAIQSLCGKTSKEIPYGS